MKSCRFSLLLIIGYVCCFSEVAGAYELETFKASYRAYYDDEEVGTAEFQVQQLDESTFKMLYHSKVSKFFLSDKRFEESVFTIQNSQIIPQNYSYKRTGTGRNKSLEVEFDHQNDRIWVNGKNTFAWDGELDNQLFRLDLSKKLSDQQTTIAYDFINYRGEKRHYEIEVISDENISLPFGNLQAIKVQINRESSTRMTFAWFAPELNYTLVRLQQFKDGDEQGDIRLANYEVTTPTNYTVNNP